MIETISLVLFISAVLFVALLAPKPSGKDPKPSGKDPEPAGQEKKDPDSPGEQIIVRIARTSGGFASERCAGNRNLRMGSSHRFAPATDRPPTHPQTRSPGSNSCA